MTDNKIYGQKCDFCSPAQPARWDYPTRSFKLVFPSGSKPPGFNSIGDWLACDRCSKSIDSKDIDAMVGLTSNGLIDANYRLLIKTFFNNQVGEKKPFG